MIQKVKHLILMATVIFSATVSMAQNSDAEKEEHGVAISPSTLRFNAKPGTTQVKTLKITNDTKRTYAFKISLQDIMLDNATGAEVPASKGFRYALSPYLLITPNVVELKPRESKVVTITANIPSNDTNAIALWSQLIIDQMDERGKLEVPSGNQKSVGLGIKAGMGFAVKIFQNPPNVTTNNVEIIKLKYHAGNAEKKQGNLLKMKVKNTGSGIGYCLYYIELTHLTTGRQTKLKVKQFGVLPGYEKEISFELPAELQKGNYSALSVLDFGSKETIQTAEIEFKMD